MQKQRTCSVDCVEVLRLLLIGDLAAMEIDKENIEQHPLEPFFPDGARLLLMGSFPPKRERWKMDFYYPNFQNDMWRIIGLVFFGEKDYFLTEDKKSFCESRIRDFLSHKGIALTDSGREVIRQKGNASDKFLEIVKTINLSEVLRRLPSCEAIVTTGQKATDTLLSMIEAQQPGVGQAVEFIHDGRKLRLYRMPSSSRAYPKPLAAKAEEYKKMFQEMGML